MRSKVLPAILATLVVAVACFDASSTSAPLERANATPASQQYSFYLNGNSYGPNGELLIEQSCQPTYGTKLDTHIVIKPVNDTVRITTNKYEKQGCLPFQYDGPYNGGRTNMTYIYGSENAALGSVDADGTENGSISTSSNSPGAAEIHFESLENPGCSFLYYDVYGGPNNGRYTSAQVFFYAFELNGATVHAVFQCSS